PFRLETSGVSGILVAGLCWEVDAAAAPAVWDRGRSPPSTLSFMSFSSKAIVVTGATSGIGRATAEAFGREGARVMLVGRDDAALADVADVVSASGGQAIACRADVTAHDAPEAIVGRAVEAFGGLDVLVNAAGVIATG